MFESFKRAERVNDCELNAFKRFIVDFRREHPHIKIIVTADGLYAKAPCVTLFKKTIMSFILSAKPRDHKFLFDLLDQSNKKFRI